MADSKQSIACSSASDTDEEDVEDIFEVGFESSWDEGSVFKSFSTIAGPNKKI